VPDGQPNVNDTTGTRCAITASSFASYAVVVEARLAELDAVALCLDRERPRERGDVGAMHASRQGAEMFTPTGRSVSARGGRDLLSQRWRRLVAGDQESESAGLRNRCR
jgi:hypothetical protein